MAVGWTWDGLDGIWSSRCLLLKFGAEVLAMCMASDLAGVPKLLDVGLSFDGVVGFCLVFRNLVLSLVYRMLV